MKKTGKLRLLYLFLIGINACLVTGDTQILIAQNSDISVEARLSETNIYNGEAVLLEFVISGRSLNRIDRPRVLDVPGLRWISGSNRQGQSIQYVNGRPSVTYTYGYQFVASTVGDYTLPSFTLTVNDQAYTTQPISFRVLDPAQVGANNPAGNPEIFVRLEPNKTTAYLGEQIIVDVVLYFKNSIEVRSYQASPGWKAEGFWKEELNNAQQTRASSTLVNGERYQRARLLQYALFPSKRGSLELSPFEVTVLIQQRNRRQDIFSFGLGQERKNIQTLPVEMTIESPAEPNLSDHELLIGAVGDFTIERSLSHSETLVGESLEIITQIKGSGNLPLIQAPVYNYPEELEQYNPQESTSIERTQSQISGTKTFTDIVIARNEGLYRIPAATIYYFDAEKNNYTPVVLPELILSVERDLNATNEPAELLRFDIQPVTGLVSWKSDSTITLTQNPRIFLIWILPLLLVLMGWIYKGYHDKMKNDGQFARRQLARKLAFDHLTVLQKKAEEHFDSSASVKAYYHDLYQLLTKYIADKCGLPPAGWSTEELVKQLSASMKGSENELLKTIRNFLIKCDTIAYAPVTSSSDVLTDLQLVRDCINQLEKELKS